MQPVNAITRGGKLYVGAERVEPGALSNLSAETVYLKADFALLVVLTVLDALHGKSVVLLAAPPKNARASKMMPPYGMKLVVPR